jgi:hypothetical protein
MIRIGVSFQEDPIGSGCHRGQKERRYMFAAPPAGTARTASGLLHGVSGIEYHNRSCGST